MHVNADFGLCVTCERRVEFFVICELSCLAWLSCRLAECGPSFSALWLRFQDKPFVTYLVAFMILTDMICNAEIGFLQVYAFPTSHSTQELTWFLCERENVLVITRDAWKGQIFLRDSILQQGVGDPVDTIFSLDKVHVTSPWLK